MIRTTPTSREASSDGTRGTGRRRPIGLICIDTEEITSGPKRCPLGPKGGATGPSVGAKLEGKNRNGWRRWSADGTITTFDVNRVVEWDITFWGFKAPRWGYQIEPLPSGASRVTETWQDHRNAVLRSSPLPGYLITGQKDRPAANRSGMEATLAKIKATAEATSRS